AAQAAALHSYFRAERRFGKGEPVTVTAALRAEPPRFSDRRVVARGTGSLLRRTRSRDTP
ncbi:MAG TPA: hypothetical protein VF883_16030, partial [Thermoanaerobaculia bacterium]